MSRLKRFMHFPASHQNYQFGVFFWERLLVMGNAFLIKIFVFPLYLFRRRRPNILISRYREIREGGLAKN